MTAKRSRAAFEADLQALQSPYVFYGTPLPPLDPDVRDDGSYVPVWKQEVTDDKGRKRLHGAFTGGYSAGYFNTVGSKEGWAPSAFVSSRQNRAKDSKQNTTQRPEDFMDEEDLREAEDSRQMQTMDGFAGFGSTEQDSTRLGGLMDILRIDGETMGVKLLKRMGWREGQGLGPKIRRQARLDEDENMGNETHIFAPKNTEMVSFNRKTDYKGLGFETESRLVGAPRQNLIMKEEQYSDEDDSPHNILSKPKKTKQVKRGGFGVGILNDTGSDEEDPYQMGPQISYNRTLGGDKKKKKGPENGKASSGIANPLLKSKPIFVSKKQMAKSKEGFRRCHDGRLPLEGFMMSSIISLETNDARKYAAPHIPKDWTSSKVPTTSRDSSKYLSTADAAKASSLNPKSRAALLGEAQLPGKSVFDFMTSSARERIIATSGKSDLPPALNEAAPKGHENTDEERKRDLFNLVPKLEKALALQALGRGVGGWMPYAEDESKRSRYRAFLEIQAELRQGLPLRIPGMSTDDWLKELGEFAHAARMFKPMTGMMASRFTSSSSTPKLASDGAEVPMEQPLLSKPAPKPDDAAEEAAKMGMFGPMTRSVQPFYPSRLLCKRFNIKPPAHVQVDPGDAPEGRDPTADGSGSRIQSAGYQSSSKPSLELVSKEVVNRLLLESGNGGQRLDSPSLLEAEKPGKPEIDAERNEALEGERPGESVFKAIFGSDDEDED